MKKKQKSGNKEVSLDDKLNRLIEHKKHENSALKKIYNSLQKGNKKQKPE